MNVSHIVVDLKKSNIYHIKNCKFWNQVCILSSLYTINLTCLT